MRPSAVTSAGSGRLRALTWLSAAALVGMLSSCAIDAPGSSRSPATGVGGGNEEGVGDCAHDLCASGAALDPTCDTCVADVCAADDFCCTVEWDSVCVGQAEDLCGLDCGIAGCAHDLCEAGAALDPTCDPCVEAVCLNEPGCCDSDWGPSCVARAEQTCGLDCAPGGTCEHELCEAGTPLDPACDPCVANVCNADSFCCEVEWDAVCVDLGVQICGLDCGGGGTCEHELCDVGTPLDPTCDACVADVCNADSFCCDVEWDAICVDLAVQICGLDCGGGTCEHELCETGVALDPTCDPCVADVCNADSFCCDTEWDSICVGEAEDICGLDCGPAPPECGNGSCELGEHCLSCPEDCGECPACPHDVCDAGSALPFGCNTCTPNVCKVDSFCCEVAWDSICVDLVPQHCARPCE
jgi:hypothetical protein